MNFFCGEWQYLKDPEVLQSISFFELFRFKVAFDIDKKILDQNFYKLQRVFHPDKYINKSDSDLVDSSTVYSSFINNGYKTLSDDFERAKYILELKGYKALAKEETITDPELLEFIMETRESIDNCLSTIELEMHKSIIENKRVQLIKEIETLFKEEKYKLVESLVTKLKYHNRILEAIDEKSREFI